MILEPRSERGDPGTGVPEGGPRNGARILVFALEGREFGIPIEGVVEIIRYRPATPVPGTDESIEGILPFRGRMVTLFSARRRLALPERSSDAPARIIVLRDGEDLVGLVVDAVARVSPAPSEDRLPLPESLRLREEQLYSGAMGTQGSYVLLLDLVALFEGMREST